MKPMSNTSELHTQFIRAYDAFVEELFSYFLSKTWERHVAKSLTEKVYQKTWNQLQHETGPHDFKSIRKMLLRNAERMVENGYYRLSPAL
jgi:hypothetical protein